jgi:hypothetical protein
MRLARGWARYVRIRAVGRQVTSGFFSSTSGPRHLFIQMADQRQLHALDQRQVASWAIAARATCRLKASCASARTSSG